MRTHFHLALIIACFGAGGILPARAQSHLIYETADEFFGSGDFDGDGRTDLVIVDKESGKFRLGYQLAPGTFSWVDNRPSGLKGVSGFTIGKLLTNSSDALAFTSPDANQVTIVDVSNPTASSRPITVPFSAALGPNTIVAVHIGGAGATALDDLYVGSIYNSPDANQATLLRNNRADFPKIAEETLPGTPGRGNRLHGQTDRLGLMVTQDSGATFRLEDLSTGQPRALVSVNGLATGSEYAAGSFRGKGQLELLFYKPGENKLMVRPVSEAAAGAVELGKGDSFDLGQAIRRAIILDQGSGQKLFVIFGEGESGGVFNFDGTKAPALSQTIVATNELLTCAVGTPSGLLVFSRPTAGKFSTRYYAYNSAATAYSFAAFGGLPSLADNDNITIPDIHDRIEANQKVKSEGEMKVYTNTIPGTRVTYTMVPIPGGEFTMGSPASEGSRKPDEGPQHKVRISPFWMGECEVTWNEYELFMYPDEEHRMRANEKTDEAADKLADAITHPSKPYVEMSFGMGKDGFPAIAMTQHGANKYCQWLSAKTGEFYRLPTEAEWEYAARAGTTNAYFFGDDPKQLPQYAWFEQNSDFKYQKVHKKKPNPWGLYDIYGNVTEWVLDQYDAEYYKQCVDAGSSPVVDPWNRATKPYPHSARGGSWDDEASMCRSAARRGSDRAWKMQDPQLPKSIWYFSDAQFIGFRIVRPLKVPSSEQMQKYWSSGVERD